MASSSLRPKALGLSRTKLQSAHLAALLSSPFLERINRLDLADNRLDDDVVDQLLEHGLGEAVVDLSGNQITPDHFARLTSTMGQRVRGAQKQRSAPPRLVGGSLSFVLAEGGDPSPQKPYPGKAVKALKLHAHSLNGSKKWFVGYATKGKGHELAFISARGKRVDPNPAIFVPPMKYDDNLVFAVNEKRKIAAVICVGVGLFMVDLDTGSATKIDEVDGVLAAALFVDDALVFTNSGSTTMLEIYQQADDGWARTEPIELRELGYKSLVACGDRMALSAALHTTVDTPAVFFERRAGQWQRLGQVVSKIGARPYVGPGSDGGLYLYVDYKRYVLER